MEFGDVNLFNSTSTSSSGITMMESMTNNTLEVNSTNMSTEIVEDLMRWALNEELVGGVISFFISVEFLLSFVINSFIILHTICHVKSLRQSSTVLLFNLALANIIMTVLFMPFAIVASAAEEWIIGSTDAQREIPCQITAFVFAYSVSISIHTLAAISFDRFLLIVKPYWHKRVMTWKTALGVVIFIWLYSILLDTTPFYGLGDYDWAGSVGACIPVWVNNRNYVIFFSLLSLVPFTIIVVTTTWTYIFTRRFLRKDFIRRKNTVSKERLETEKNVYNERLRNLLGIFGTLLLFNILTLSPYITASVVGLIVGLENLPSEVFAIAFVLFLLSNVTNSITQAYFRKELRSTIVKYTMKLAMLLHCDTGVSKCMSLCSCCHGNEKNVEHPPVSNADDLENGELGRNGNAGSRVGVDQTGSHDDNNDGVQYNDGMISKAGSTEILGSVDLVVTSENDDPLPIDTNIKTENAHVHST